jgi:predicted ATPase
MGGMMDGPVRPLPFISRVRLKNYKSIAECDVRLGPLTILIGPNGTGKSNFLDALAFLTRAVATTPYEAINERGGFGEVLRQVPTLKDRLRIAIEFSVPGVGGRAEDTGSYEFEIARPLGPGERSLEVAYEQCTLRLGDQVEEFRAERGVIQATWLHDREAVIQPDRLFLQAADVLHSFAPLFVGLREMRFYNFDLEVLRKPHRPTTGAVLGRQGDGLGDVLDALEKGHSGYKGRLDAYLRAVLPGAASLERDFAGGYVTVLLRTMFGEGAGPKNFGPEAMSDGTIRAAAVLAALFQPWTLEGRVPLIGIEEPEIALHPAAAGVLFDALTEASEHVQVVATSQSPDLLDRDDLDVSSVRAVSMAHGLTVIGEVDEASRRIVRDKLYTLGELMRSDQILPEPIANGDYKQPKA